MQQGARHHHGGLLHDSVELCGYTFVEHFTTPWEAELCSCDNMALVHSRCLARCGSHLLASTFLSQEHDREVADKVMMERFRRHNCLWLSIVTGEIPDDSIDVCDMQDDDCLDPYYHLQMADMLENSDLYYDESAADSVVEGGEVHPYEANRLLYTSPDVQNFLNGDEAYMYHVT